MIYDHETEALALGGAFLSHDWACQLTTVLTAGEFFDPRNRFIFDSIDYLLKAESKVSFESVRSRIAYQDCSSDHLLNIVAVANTGHVFKDLAKRLKAHKDLRSLDRLGVDVTKRAHAKHDPLEIISEAERALFKISLGDSSSSPKNMDEILKEPTDILEVIQTRQQMKKDGFQVFQGTPTGYLDLDAKVSGLSPGHLTIIGARPAMGKTSFALNLIQNLCLEKKQKVLFFSLEMPMTEVAEKMLCQTAEVKLGSVKDGSVTATDFQKIVISKKKWEGKAFIIDDQPSLDIEQIHSRSKRYHRSEGINAIFIDYAQLIRAKGHESRHLEIGFISRSLKELAKTLQLPVIALAQLNRDLEKREKKTPTIADLRESGSLEADADEILLLHRPEVYDPYDKAGLIQIIIGKNRFGEIGSFYLNFNKETGRMTNHSIKEMFDEQKASKEYFNPSNY